MRTSSRCQGSSFGEYFSTKYSMFSCGSAGKRAFACRPAFGGTLRQRAPQIVELAFAVRLALGQPRRLGLQCRRGRAAIAVDAVRHQRVAGVEHLLDRRGTVPLLALHHVAAGEDEVVEDRVGRGPLPEQVIALEEGVVAIAGVRDDQRLRRHRVLLHQVGDAGIGIDDDFVGEALHAAPVGLLVADELLAVRPVRIAHRQSARRVGVQHLLGGDDLDLVRVGVEPVLGGDLRDRPVVAFEQVRSPSRRLRRVGIIGVFLAEQLAEDRIDLVAPRRMAHGEVAARLGHALVFGPQAGRALLRVGGGELQVGVVARRRQQPLAQEPRAARRIGTERVAVGGLRRVDVPAARIALARESCPRAPAPNRPPCRRSACRGRTFPRRLPRRRRCGG